ncbi:MAG: hypothetical protein ACREWE_02170 [Gammaproteobacteria bacterium]
MRLAAQGIDGRVEVEKAVRDEVRRIAVPLKLGEMGETHFVLRDDWKNELLRKQAQDGVKELTVRRLRRWIEKPEPRGLEREIQDLVILAFALETGRSFYLHGGPIDPPLENLDDEMELREQRLPHQASWTEAVRRGAAILGVAVSPLLNAQNVARLCDEAAKIAEERRADVDRLRTSLHARLQTFGIEIRETDRYRTAEAAAALVVAIRAGEGDAVIEALATAPIATSETAMGQAIKGARQTADALEGTEWRIFDKIRSFSGTYRVRAEGIVQGVTEALIHDEHVSPLASTLRRAQSEAVNLLVEAATRPPTAEEPPKPEAPIHGRMLAKQGRKTVRGSEAGQVFQAIQADLAGRSGTTLEVDWKIYTEGE